MTQNCKFCGEFAVENDNSNYQDQLICTACGAVVAEDTLQNDQGFTGTTFVRGTDSFVDSGVQLNLENAPSGIKYAAFSNKKSLMVEGLRKLEIVVRDLNFTADMIEGAKKLYKQTVVMETFKHKGEKIKVGLVAACIYTVLRQHDWPIPMRMVCSKLEVCQTDFNAANNFLKSHESIKIFSPTVIEIIPVILKQIDISENFAEVEKLTNKIVSLLEKCWLTTGRMPQIVIAVSAYLADKIVNKRKNTSVRKFFCNMGMSIGPLSNRHAEVMQLFTKLAKHLPWLKNTTIKSHNVHMYVQDVLKYQKSLLKDAITEYKEKQTEEVTDDMSTFMEFRKTKLKRGQISETVSSKRSKHSEDDIENGDAVLSDNELDQYIRSDKEVEALLKLKEKFCTKENI